MSKISSRKAAMFAIVAAVIGAATGAVIGAATGVVHGDGSTIGHDGTRPDWCGEAAEAVLERDPEIRLSLELARTAEERARGLMFREGLEADAGMLFVFEGPVLASFWMRNTLVPLSIAFLSEQGEVVDIQDMEPLSDELHTPPVHYWFALEVNRGWFTEHGVGVGDRLVLCLPQ